MQLHELKPTTKQKSPKRVGRGGAHGTYATRGIKGQKSRSGSSVRPGFEGGRTPLQKLLPKRRGVGFKKLHKKITVINLGALDILFKEGEIINPTTLVEKKIIDQPRQGFKILSNGKITHRLMIENCIISEKAKEKILKAGGKVTVK